MRCEMHKDKTMILQSDGQSKRQMEEIIYLSGPMSGIPKFNFPAFYEAELWITEHMMCSIINPARNVQGLSYDDYMNIDLYLMKLATTIVQLPGWEKSKGAKREYKYAILRGMKIIEYQDMKRCAEAGVLD
ncbi:MAG: DUF4406 domain-containing protein, partial [Alphaproteobacteria bacterium]|nr:DUF4406 domain-containing protein [Alphaproteobacteria bacterium]